MSVPQALADGGIRFSVEHLGDGCWEYALLEDAQKIVVMMTGLGSFAEAEAWLAANAVARFPDSAFAKRRNQPDPTTEAQRPENKGALL